MRLGVHISAAGPHKGEKHISETFQAALALGCNTMQIFSRNPQSWRKGRLSEEEIDAFRAKKAESGIAPVFIHIPYVINLASPQPALYGASIKAYIEDVLEAEALGVEYIVTHMGSHKETGEEKGLKRITSALNVILDRTKKSSVTMLLENTAGAGSWLGYKFEHQAKIIKGIENKERVGVCLDTCHAYAAGYDLTDASGARAVIGALDKIVGLKKLKLIHLNDALDKIDSRRDRHAHIGKGKIGLEGFSALLNDKRLKDVAWILETPKDTVYADKMNLEIVRHLIRRK